MKRVLFCALLAACSGGNPVGRVKSGMSKVCIDGVVYLENCIRACNSYAITPKLLPSGKPETCGTQSLADVKGGIRIKAGPVETHPKTWPIQ